MRIWTWLGVAGLAVVAAGVAAGVTATVLAKRDVRARVARLEAERHVAQTSHGPVEYVTWGRGPPVLVVHGAGGGFDQGRLIAQACGGEGFTWIAPSRFGYLGGPPPADPSTPAQADAFVELLDQLGVERVGVLAFSGGVPPALQLAERHPDRVAGLALLSSAPFTPYSPDIEGRPLPGWLYQALFGNDVVYWTLSKTSRGALERAFDARTELREGLSAEEQAFVHDVVDTFLPASRRLAGVLNEGAAIDPATTYALEDVSAPTLVIHARDDRINPFDVGATITARVPGAELVPFDAGGHLLLGHHAEVRARVSGFLARSLETPRGG